MVEVGIDNPQASVMLVEHADRFGLAQLHQLRGRVGRGSRASTCYLMAPADNDSAVERLRVLEQSQNGWHVAEADLRTRYGMLQPCVAQPATQWHVAFGISRSARQAL